MHLTDNNIYIQFLKTFKQFEEYKKANIPLCAAENVISDFVKLPLMSSVQEKYVMGGCLHFDDDNFIGGNKIYPIYHLINKQCEKLFNSKYADSRTLSGMNSVTTLLMSMTEPGDTIAITPPNCGGHASIPDICHRLGLKTIDLPYKYEQFNIDYDNINKMLRSTKPTIVLICLSDIVNVPDFSKIDQSLEIPIIYDATQTLGLISGKSIDNPLNSFDDNYPFILMGATHKTLAGPTASLIMTRNLKLANKIEKLINPTYLRNTQMHQKISLLFALLESEYFGEDYSNLILNNARTLGNKLNEVGFDILNKSQGISKTHQIFFSCPFEEMNSFYENCDYYNISLNYKTKKLFNYSGIRIGVQEISRYNWHEEELNCITELLSLMRMPQVYQNKSKNQQIENIIELLVCKKNIDFTFQSNEYSSLRKIFDIMD